MFCPNCGSQMPDNYKFCKKCGHLLPSKTTIQSQQEVEPLTSNNYSIHKKHFNPLYLLIIPIALCFGIFALLLGYTNGNISEMPAAVHELFLFNKNNGFVHAGMIHVEVTIPNDFLGDDSTTMDDTIKSYGIKDIHDNNDGTVTYKMTKKAYAELMKSFDSSIEESISDIMNDSDTPTSIHEISHKDDMSEFTILVDSSQYSGWEEFYAIAFCMEGMIYQAFDGIPEDEIYTVVKFIDQDTEELISSVNSSDLENIDDSTDSIQEQDDSIDSIQESQEQLVWIPASGNKYHKKSSCSGMENPQQVTISEAKSMGYTPCQKCY